MLPCRSLPPFLSPHPNHPPFRRSRSSFTSGPEPRAGQTLGLCATAPLPSALGNEQLKRRPFLFYAPQPLRRGSSSWADKGQPFPVVTPTPARFAFCPFIVEPFSSPCFSMECRVLVRAAGCVSARNFCLSFCALNVFSPLFVAFLFVLRRARVANRGAGSWCDLCRVVRSTPSRSTKVKPAGQDGHPIFQMTKRRGL